MKQRINSRGGGGGGRLSIPNKKEVEVVEILLTLQKTFEKIDALKRYTFTWGRKKKRSALVSKSESSSSTHRHNYESEPEKVTAPEVEKSPSTPLSFLPNGSGSDCDNKPKKQSSSMKISKKKETDNSMETYNGLQQQNVILKRKIEAMKSVRQELMAQNLELKAKGQKRNYPGNMEHFQFWKHSIEVNLDQHHHHQQITMRPHPLPPPPPPPPQPQYQQLVVDPNTGKMVVMSSCSGTGNDGGRFRLFNQMDPRVKNHGKAFEFMASSQPIDQCKYVVMDDDLRIRTAAAARKKRILKMKENKNSLLAMKPARVCR